MLNAIMNVFNKIDDVMYYPVLIIILASAGLYFSCRTKFVQLRMFKEACRLIVEKPKGEQKVSSFQALIVSTASRVGTGNIVGVSTAICLGGPGACFWMWLMCIIGAASAFVESTLAQIYKRKNQDGSCYGGPAYYIEQALKKPLISKLFCIFLIATYAVGFNLLCSFNLQSSFEVYSFYDKQVTPIVVGIILAITVGYCIMGGGKRIIKLTEKVVPFMGIAYVLISLIIIFANVKNVPHMFMLIFKDAFDLRSIFGGLAGSCMVMGIKRGLYSNEAGVGSAPNASASADVTHPVKQGLVQTVSVYIDTILLCTATAFMCLSSGTPYNDKVSGAMYVQNAISTVFGSAGPVFITAAMVLFAFTTLLGNLYYVDNALIYLNGKKEPSKRFMTGFYIVCVIIIFAGTLMEMSFAWTIADITMGFMTLINIPCCFMLSKQVFAALADYEKQKKDGKDPHFMAKDIGLDTNLLSFWK
ncbi:MAG: alanine:cation symporter family protein [Ruminococcus sp.]|nr:alanine:cation symporter family protein [Ruminococcus sp.]MBP3798207.1 alanine:cation symporter family protein [Ruminococcus sp.]